MVYRPDHRPAHHADAEPAEHFGQTDDLRFRSHVGGNRATVLAAVLLASVDGEAERAGLHPLVEQLLQAVELLVGDRRAFPGGDHPQDIAPKRAEGKQGAYVDSETLAVEAIEVLGIRFPVPPHALAHRIERDCLDAVHHAHIEVAVFGPCRREAEPALADGHRGLPEPPVEGGVRVPVKLGVVVGMEVDGARRHDTSAGIELGGGAGRNVSADLGDPSILDSQVGAVAGHAGPFDDRAAADYEVILGHGLSPPARLQRPTSEAS